MTSLQIIVLFITLVMVGIMFFGVIPYLFTINSTILNGVGAILVLGTLLAIILVINKMFFQKEKQ